MKTIVKILVPCLLFFAVGCSSLEQTAYDAVVGAKAFTKSVGANHAECGTRNAADKWVSSHNSTGVCVALDKAIVGKDVLIDLSEAYCGGTQFDAGGKCTPPNDPAVKNVLAEKLQTAISLYGQTENDVKNLLK